jgi:hypothetical protein
VGSEGKWRIGKPMFFTMAFALSLGAGLQAGDEVNTYRIKSRHVFAGNV